MNGRIRDKESTPAERLAAVARTLMEKIRTEYERTLAGPKEPDYADFREALRPYVQQELLFARIDERRKMCGDMVSQRMTILEAELLVVQRDIPEQDWL
jgi:hypothetical protein